MSPTRGAAGGLSSARGAPAGGLSSARAGTVGNAVLAQAVKAGDDPAVLPPVGNAALAQAVQGSLPPGNYTVVVVGSPGPGELPGHAFQFADAGAQVGGAQRVWLVERTGYDRAGVDPAQIEARAGGATVLWITPERTLADRLRQFPPGSITGLHVFSHGVPGALTLRYGWPDLKDYGLSLAEARGLPPAPFTADAEVTFDSCNTGTDPSLLPGIEYGERSLAAEVADATGRPVTAWLGRTSYRQVNRGTGGVIGSEVFGGGLRPDMTEVYSSVLRQRTPRQYITAPSRSPGSWTSWFRMKARLPRTRSFPVPASGSITVTIAARSEFEPMLGARINVWLHRGDDDISKQLAIVGQESVLTWSGLEEGTYHLELFHGSGLEVEGDISVAVRAGP
ncbi:hypothetical protein AB0M02_43010 [Actinoplanes sp. NPDC051861]|uniref:hypothetical protein n=1 Tax=Actinoplanes sp. NPDC051861 TaxID=3155170 RepID=UPI00343734FB